MEDLITAVLIVVIPLILTPIIGFIVWIIRSKLKKTQKIRHDKRSRRISLLERQLERFLWPLFFKLQRHLILTQRYRAIRQGKLNDSSPASNDLDHVSLDREPTYFDNISFGGHTVPSTPTRCQTPTLEIIVENQTETQTTRTAGIPLNENTSSESQHQSQEHDQHRVIVPTDLGDALTKTKAYLDMAKIVDEEILKNLLEMRHIIYLQMTVMGIYPKSPFAEAIYHLDKFVTLYEAFRKSGDFETLPGEAHRAAYPEELEKLLRQLLFRTQLEYQTLVDLHIS